VVPWAAVFTSLFPMVFYLNCAAMSGKKCSRLPVFCRHPVIRQFVFNLKRFTGEIKMIWFRNFKVYFLTTLFTIFLPFIISSCSTKHYYESSSKNFVRCKVRAEIELNECLKDAQEKKYNCEKCTRRNKNDYYYGNCYNLPKKYFIIFPYIDCYAYEEECREDFDRAWINCGGRITRN
jgi:hypothetical protein